uniref:Echinoderm microtubule-associated protein-like 4 n=1 Tax=Electrophorus electricus TaxID=8005 RepID=A0AAY5EQS1_ELEEL
TPNSLPHISAASASDVQDRLSSLELRVQQQEDELTVMKAALADVLRRLAQSEDTAAKKQQSAKGQTPLREAFSMSCITNGSSGGRKSHRDSSAVSHRDSSTVSVARKETLSSAAKSTPSPDTPPPLKASRERCPPSAPRTSPLSPQPLSSVCPARRGASGRRGGGMERSQSSTWESSEESRNKLVKAASTSKLLAKVVKNAEKFVTHAQGDYIKMFMRGRPITMFIPSDVENYDDVRTELPPERLKLEWVYGYRGRDCRANVCLLPTGEIVYFIASVVVLFNFDERTQRHYLGHTDCVKCLAVHPDKIRIATGQLAGVDKDGRPLQPHVRVWDSVTLTTLQVIGLGTFERGVGSLAFSKADSGTHLSVIDDSNEHMLTVWDWQKKSKIAEIKTTNEVVLAVEFHPTDANTIVTCGKSHIFFWTWSGNSLARKQGIFGKYEKPKFVQCLAFLNNGDILTGDSGGILLIWARSTVEPAPGKGPKGAFQILRQIKAHDGSVFTLCQMRNGTLLTGGGKDHKIILWDHDLNPERDIEVPDQYGTIRAVAEGKGEQFLVGTSRNFILRGTFNDGFQVEVQGHTDELWGLATHPFKELFLTCAQDRQVCLWNAVDHSLEWSRLLDEHGHCADFHPSGAVVAIGTHSGKWYALDAETRDLVAIHTDGNEQLSVMRYTVDGTLLAVGSHDNFIYLYTVSDKGRKYSRYGKCTGHSSYITHLDWSPDNKFIMSNSGDYEILYWDIPNGCKLIRNRSECKDIDWASYTCVLGFHVFGVWPEGSDGTDINALVRSHNRKVIALADDFCKVHLFQYPCSRPKAPSHKYSAHSSHVTNVSFLHSDSHLVSTGGKDTSIMQWRLVEKMPALVPSDTALGLTDSLPHNSSLRGAPFAPAMPQTTTTPVAVPSSLPIGGTQPDTNTPPPTPTESLEPTPNGQQEGLPETPPPLDEVTPPSDSTVSPKDSLEPSDDTATPSDEGTPFSPPS